MDGLGSPSFHDLDGRVKEPVEPWTRSAWSEKKGDPLWSEIKGGASVLYCNEGLSRLRHRQ